MPCPDENRLVEYVEGVLAEEGAHAIEHHVDGCPSCRRVLATFALGSQPDDAGDDPARLSIPAPGDRYTIHEVLGTGGMSIVYAATDRVLDRRVAYKVLRDPDPEQAARLQREARAMARLAHPNVVPVHDCGLAEGRMFLTAELVDGRPLDAWLVEAPRSWRAIVEVFVQAGRGLAAAHAAGITHRDVKPSNVLVGRDGRVRVADFGLARPARPSGDLGDLARSSTSLAGTPLYMAPEQLAGAPASAASDQFGFCVALYEALYGARPFRGADLGELQRAIHAGPVLSRRVGGPLRRILRRGLAVAPADRFPSLDALVVALDRTRHRRRRWITTGAVALAAGAVAAGLTTYALDARAPSCAAPAWSGVWDEARRAELARAFAATAAPTAAEAATAVTARLDRWTERWTQTHLDTCEATDVRGERSARMRDQAIACLAERRVELAALTELFASADARVVERAVFAIDQLGDPGSCGDPRRLAEEPELPADLYGYMTVAALRAELGRGRALRVAGKYDAAVAILTSRRPAVVAARHRPLEAAFALELGILHALRLEARPAETLLLEALAAAQATGDTAVIATAATQLASVMGNQRQQFAEARRWVTLASGAVERLGDRARLADLAMVRGALALSEGDAAEAQAQYRRAYELRVALAGPADPSSAVALHGVALGALRGGDAVAALRELDRARALLEPVLGHGHPRVADLLSDRGRALGELGRLDESEAALRDAVAIREAAYGPDNARVAETLLDLAATLQWQRRFADALVVAQRARRIYEVAGSEADVGLVLVSEGLALAELGRFAEARERLGRALAIQEATVGAEHVDLSITLGALATVERRGGEPSAALRHARRALAIVERASGGESAALISPLVVLVDCAVAAGAREDAIEAGERARRIAARAPDDELASALAEFALARALGPGDRGDLLARAARARFARLAAPELADVDAWLQGR